MTLDKYKEQLENCIKKYKLGYYLTYYINFLDSNELQFIGITFDGQLVIDMYIRDNGDISYYVEQPNIKKDIVNCYNENIGNLSTIINNIKEIIIDYT